MQTKKKKPAAIYVTKPEFLSELCEELGEFSQIIEDMVFSSQIKTNICFALDVWFEPQIVSFQSISEAVKILRQAGKFWYMHPVSQIRRARLIEEQLRKYPSLQRHFPIETEIPSPI